MSGSPPSLRELVDIDELQSIQDSFARAVGISSVILSPECEPLTRFTNPTGFCALIQSTEKGKERCFRSFMEMGKIALGAQEPEMCYCFAHGGHFVAPIMIDGEYKGTMFAGQFTPEKFSSEQLHDLEEIAQEIDIDPWLLVKEAEKMRVVGEDVIRNYSSLLFKIVETIARRGAQAAELERRVQERTGELAGANKELVQEVTERKLAEDALQKERDRAQHYLDAAGVMFLVIGADRKVSLINRKGCEILGYEGEEGITGKDWFDNFVPKRLRDEVARGFGSLIAGEIEPVEYYENTVLTKHGEEKIVAWHNTILRDEQGGIYATMASGADITEQKRAEAALRESEEKFRLLAENSIDCIWVVDTRLRFTYLSPSVERMMGFKPEQWVGTKLSSHFKKKEFLKVGAMAAKFIKNYKTFTHSTFETKMLNSKNDEVDIEISSKALLNSQGKIIGLQGSTRDITERKKAKEAFTDETIRRRILMEQSRDGIVILDRDGNVYESNQRFAEMLGFSHEEVSHLHAWDWELQFTREQLRYMLRNIDETGNNFETKHRRKDGTIYDAEISANGAVFAGEKLIFCVCRDITERKRIEKALKDRVEFEKIVASISTSFINLAPDEIDIGIEDALRSIGEFSGVDRSYLFRLFDDGTKTENTHEWCARGIVPQIENLKGLSVADFPWFLERLNRFEAIHIPSVASLPREVDAEKEILQSGDVLSAILVPMVYGGTLVGFIGFDSVRQEKSWSEENIALLRIICEIFVNALERKRVMGAIQSSETKFHAIFEKNPLGAAIIDKERKIREVNDAAVALIGRPREEIIGMACHEFICPRGDKECPIYDHGRTIDHTEGILLSKDHGEIPIEKTATQITIDGEPVVLEMFYDITRRKAAEKAITESEEKLRMITASANDAILMMDHKGNLSYWNKAAEQMFDFTEEEVIGKDLHTLLVPERFHPAFSKGFEGFKKTGQGDALGKTLDVAAIGKDGTEFPVELSLSAVKLKGRWNAIGLIRGIAERKAAEEELKKKADELEKFNRLAVGRELKMIELKKEINGLLGELDKESGYKIVGEP